MSFFLLQLTDGKAMKGADQNVWWCEQKKAL